MSAHVAQRGTNKRTDRSSSYKSESERFWLRVDKTNSCWNWTAGIGGGRSSALLCWPPASRASSPVLVRTSWRGNTRGSSHRPPMQEPEVREP